MEEIFGSQCSSGCESGWTIYLEHSHSLETQFNGHAFITAKEKGYCTHEDDEEDEEEDMSMVSDASSGPRMFQEHEEECYDSNNNGVGAIDESGLDDPRCLKKKKILKISNSRSKVRDLQSFQLDDTASSPFFDFSNKNKAVPRNQASMAVGEKIVDYSQGYSTAYFQEKSAFQHHFGLFPSPISGTQLQQNRWF